jgi:hypothetical protein
MTVFSPNHVEALALLGKIPSPYTSDEELEELLGEWGRVDEVLEEVGMELLRVMLKGQSGSSRHRGWERGVWCSLPAGSPNFQLITPSPRRIKGRSWTLLEGEMLFSVGWWRD